MGHRQKGKGAKRRKSWHRGKAQGSRWAATVRRWPDLGVKADPTAGAPLPVRMGPGATNRGDAL